MLSFQSIPPGVLHLCCVIIALCKRLVDDDDDDDDTAPEVQTNFISSQNFTMIVYFVISRMLLLLHVFCLLVSSRSFCFTVLVRTVAVVYRCRLIVVVVIFVIESQLNIFCRCRFYLCLVIILLLSI